MENKTVIIPKNNLKIRTAPFCLPVTLHKASGRPVSIVFGSMHCTFEWFRAEGKADHQTFFCAVTGENKLPQSIPHP